jgi:hypothetical protein
MRKNKNVDEIEADSVEEAREVIRFALEDRNWLQVEEALEILNDILGYEVENDADEEDKRNHLEE